MSLISQLRSHLTVGCGIAAVLLVRFLRGPVWLAPEEFSPVEAGAGLERSGGAENSLFGRPPLLPGRRQGGLRGEGGEQVPARRPQVASPGVGGDAAALLAEIGMLRGVRGDSVPGAGAGATGGEGAGSRAEATWSPSQWTRSIR